MANVVLTLKIMPESPDVDLSRIEKLAGEKVALFGADIGKVEIEPIAFGLNAVKLILVMDEKKGSTEALEKDIAEIDGVNSCECTDVRRAVG